MTARVSLHAFDLFDTRSTRVRQVGDCPCEVPDEVMHVSKIEMEMVPPEGIAVALRALLPRPSRHSRRAFVPTSPTQPRRPTRPTQVPASRAHVWGHVLLVEDREVNLVVAVAMLEDLGCTVHTVTNGAEAVAAVQSAPYDLVLMDCKMPVLDGFEATRQIRALGGSFASLPIVALTASAILGDRERCIGAGMNDYMSKPFRCRDLARMLERWLPCADARQGEPARLRASG